MEKSEIAHPNIHVSSNLNSFKSCINILFKTQCTRCLIWRLFYASHVAKVQMLMLMPEALIKTCLFQKSILLSGLGQKIRERKPIFRADHDIFGPVWMFPGI